MGEEDGNLILIDTDAGIDDAWAILMILAAAKEDPIIKLHGITCVFGNTDVDNTCINVLRTLESSQRLDIPVYKGAQLPLISYDISEKKIGGFFGLDGFGMAEHKNSVNLKLTQKENAVVALRRIVHENKGKVSLLCLGPLTNIALAIRTYPDFVENVKQILIMGGNYKGFGNATDCAEFNFYADPEAAHIVLTSDIKRKILVPWETCCDSTFSLDWRDNVLGACDNSSIQLMNFVERPLRDKPTFVSWMTCDQLIALIALVPASVTESVASHLTVELCGQHTRGQVVVSHKLRQKPNVIVVTNFDQDLLSQSLLKIHNL